MNNPKMKACKHQPGCNFRINAGSTKARRIKIRYFLALPREIENSIEGPDPEASRTCVRRLLERIRTDGAASIRHKAIGRSSNNRISDGVRDYAVMLVRED